MAALVHSPILNLIIKSIHPRVLWVGLNDTNNKLFKLQKDLDTNFSNIGFKKEKNYKSHITIARVKYINNKYRIKSNNEFLNDLTHEIKKLNNINIGNMNVSKIYLKQSELSPNGPIYTNIKTFELNKEIE